MRQHIFFAATLLLLLCPSCNRELPTQSVAGYIVKADLEQAIVVEVTDSASVKLPSPRKMSFAIDDNTIYESNGVIEGNIVEGDLNPSSDTPTHLALYRAWPEIGGVVHTHSTYATAWAQAGRDIPNIGTTHADYFHNAIPCTESMTEEEVKGAYELETGNVIIKRFEGLNPVHTPGVLVKNHGPFSWGKDGFDAVHNAVVMEQVAKMAYIAYGVNPNLTMNDLLIEKHFNRKHGPNAYYGQKKK